jgi:aminoglycoside phosphotransferase (APT) family kinase protein
VLAVPDDLNQAQLAEALLCGWGIQVATMTYLAVGWGSHHFDVTAGDRSRWFVTVDELERKRSGEHESLADGFARLSASLRSAAALRAAGRVFVVAPVPAAGDEPAARFGGHFAVAVYPFLAGEGFGWGRWTAALRAGMLAMIAEVHLAPAAARVAARPDEFQVPFLALLEEVMDGRDPGDQGPYARPAAELLRQHATALGGRLRRYRKLVEIARQRPGRSVLTHGEPHPGNALLTSEGWRLVDWDTALTAPPERDLWHLEAAGAVTGGGSIFGDYAAATGVTPLPELIELYRLRWDLADLAVDASRLFQPHGHGPDAIRTWELLQSLASQPDH